MRLYRDFSLFGIADYLKAASAFRRDPPYFFFTELCVTSDKEISFQTRNKIPIDISLFPYFVGWMGRKWRHRKRRRLWYYTIPKETINRSYKYLLNCHGESKDSEFEKFPSTATDKNSRKLKCGWCVKENKKTEVEWSHQQLDKGGRFENWFVLSVFVEKHYISATAVAYRRRRRRIL